MDFAQGTPCWLQLLTPDAEAARGFYGPLFGWTFDGRFCLAEGRPVAQITEAPGEAWEVYLATPDVDAAAARVGPAGGSVLVEPFDVPGYGRYARAADPAGVPFVLWQAGEFGGSGLGWLDLNTRGGKEIDAFYAAVFGCSPEPVPGEAGYALWRVAGRPVAGRLEMGDAEWAGVPEHWMAYFTVDDVDRVAARAAELGGQVGYGPVDSPYGRLAIVGDPAGAPFTIIPGEGAARAWG
ncbi:VOC family protein [Nonomuraea typhae]|uniref:VOC family protein n=1 Tax=Nonomuraea typhae TaxID=2603600 RepID=A0ABW7YRA4_9ACTN